MRYSAIAAILVVGFLVHTESAIGETEIGFGVGYAQNDEPYGYVSDYTFYYGLERKETLQLNVPIVRALQASSFATFIASWTLSEFFAEA